MAWRGETTHSERACVKVVNAGLDLTQFRVDVQGMNPLTDQGKCPHYGECDTLTPAMTGRSLPFLRSRISGNTYPTCTPGLPSLSTTGRSTRPGSGRESRLFRTASTSMPECAELSASPSSGGGRRFLSVASTSTSECEGELVVMWGLPLQKSRCRHRRVAARIFIQNRRNIYCQGMGRWRQGRLAGPASERVEGDGSIRAQLVSRRRCGVSDPLPYVDKFTREVERVREDAESYRQSLLAGAGPEYSRVYVWVMNEVVPLLGDAGTG